MKKLPKIDVSVITTGNQKLIFPCLESLYKQYEGDFELYIILNCVPEEIARGLKEKFPQANFIENKEKEPFANNHNCVIERTNNKYILILSDDVKILDNTLSELVQYMENHSKAGMVNPKLLNEDLSLQECTYSDPDLFRAFLNYFGIRKFISFNKITYALSSLFYKKGASRFWNHDRTCEVNSLRGPFMLVRRKAIEEVGLMDEITLTCGEETEWMHRFNKKGWKIIFYSEAEIIHYGQQTNKKQPMVVKEGEVKSILNFFRKHKPPFQYIVLRFIIITSSFLKYLFCLIIFKKDLANLQLKNINNALHPETFLKGKRIFY